VNVSNLDRSKRFYQEGFGFGVVGESREEGRRFVFLGKEDKLVLTLWQQGEGRFEKRHPGLHHLSFQVSTIEEVKEAEQILKALNAPPHAIDSNAQAVL
jgi:lactoylglutathione lyase